MSADLFEVVAEIGEATLDHIVEHLAEQAA